MSGPARDDDERIHDALDGRLDPDALRRWSADLAADSELRAAFERAQALRRLLREEAASAAPPPSLLQDILAAVRSEGLSGPAASARPEGDRAGGWPGRVPEPAADRDAALPPFEGDRIDRSEPWARFLRRPGLVARAAGVLLVGLIAALLLAETQTPRGVRPEAMLAPEGEVAFFIDQEPSEPEGLERRAAAAMKARGSDAADSDHEGEAGLREQPGMLGFGAAQPASGQREAAVIRTALHAGPSPVARAALFLRRDERASEARALSAQLALQAPQDIAMQALIEASAAFDARFAASESGAQFAAHVDQWVAERGVPPSSVTITAGLDPATPRPSPRVARFMGPDAIRIANAVLGDRQRVAVQDPRPFNLPWVSNRGPAPFEIFSLTLATRDLDMLFAAFESELGHSLVVWAPGVVAQDQTIAVVLLALDEG